MANSKSNTTQKHFSCKFVFNFTEQFVTQPKMAKKIIVFSKNKTTRPKQFLKKIVF